MTSAAATHFKRVLIPDLSVLMGLVGNLFDDQNGGSSRRVIRPAAIPARMRRTDRAESWSPSSDWVPPWQDKPTLCMCLCLSPNTVDAWVRQGLLPPPRKRGGKLMWKWSEVEKHLEGGDPQQEELTERIRNATRKAATSDKE